MSPERSPCETRITVPGVESICWMWGNRATLWSFLLKRMFRNTDLTEATRKSLNCAQGISHTLPGGCQPRGQQRLDGWNHPDKPRNSQSNLRPRRKKDRDNSHRKETRGRPAQSTGWGAGARRCTALLEFTGHAQHRCLLGGNSAGKERKSLDMKKCEWSYEKINLSRLTPKQLWGFCIIPPVEDGHMLLSWSSFFYICIYFIEMAHGIWAITKRSIQ